MNKEHIKGGADKVKGAVKDAAGAATGNEKLQAEGKAEKAKGAAREKAGDVKDAGRKVGAPPSVSATPSAGQSQRSDCPAS